MESAQVADMAWRLRQLLNDDIMAISTMRCLKVYLERVGYRCGTLLAFHTNSSCGCSLQTGAALGATACTACPPPRPLMIGVVPIILAAAGFVLLSMCSDQVNAV